MSRGMVVSFVSNDPPPLLRPLAQVPGETLAVFQYRCIETPWRPPLAEKWLKVKVVPEVNANVSVSDFNVSRTSCKEGSGEKGAGEGGWREKRSHSLSITS